MCNRSTPLNRPRVAMSTRSSLFDQLPAAKMNAEGGYDEVSASELPPLRWSGIVCLILGVLSFAATVAIPMLILPAVAILLGLIALRKQQGDKRPAGTTPAIIGLVLAAGFGACGIAIPYLKHQTLGQQAEHFARQYLEVIARGDLPMMLELQKSAVNRQMETTDLDEYYANLSTDENSRNTLEETRSGLFGIISAAGDKPQWKLDSIRVFQKYRNEKADTYWIDTTGTIPGKIQIEMQWTPAMDGEKADWHVTLFQTYREQIYAPRVT